MSEEAYVIFAILLIILGISFYSIKRSYDENDHYIQAGYHRVPTTNETWIK